MHEIWLDWRKRIWSWRQVEWSRGGMDSMSNWCSVNSWTVDSWPSLCSARRLRRSRVTRRESRGWSGSWWVSGRGTYSEPWYADIGLWTGIVRLHSLPGITGSGMLYWIHVFLHLFLLLFLHLCSCWEFIPVHGGFPASAKCTDHCHCLSRQYSVWYMHHTAYLSNEEWKTTIYLCIRK